MQIGPMEFAVEFLLEVGDGGHVIEDEADADRGNGVGSFVKGSDSGNRHAWMLATDRGSLSESTNGAGARELEIPAGKESDAV